MRRMPGPRRREVLVLRMAGLPPHEIASRLGISPQTVRTHLHGLRVIGLWRGDAVGGTKQVSRATRRGRGLSSAPALSKGGNKA